MIKPRNERASTLALVGASAVVLAIIIVFVLLYMGVGVQTDKQRSAIDSAAIAAASDIGRIVYNSPECGFVSLTGAPPTSGAPANSSAQGTAELPLGQGNTNGIDGDGWQDQVYSINELMATARLEYILGAYIAQSGEANDNFGENLALRDQQRVLYARDELMQVIKNAISASGNYGFDASGARVQPYDDALGMFKGNQQANSSYVAAPAMTIELGCVSGGVTTPVPTPDSTAGTSLSALGTLTPASGTNGNFYLGDVDLPFPATGNSSATHWMLGSIGNQPSIIDRSKFVLIDISGSADTTYAIHSGYSMTPAPSDPNLLIPCAVRVTATQQFEIQGRKFSNTYVSCAVPGGNFRSQSYAMMTISFPDGPVPEINCMADTFYATFGNDSAGVAWGAKGSNKMATKKAEVWTSQGGDYEGSNEAFNGNLVSDYSAWGYPVPTFGGTNSGTTNSPKTLTNGQCSWLCIHNWLRTEGTQLNVASFINSLTSNFVKPSTFTNNWFQSDNKTPANTMTWNSQAWFAPPKGTGPPPPQGSGSQVACSPSAASTSPSKPASNIPVGFQEMYSFDASGNVQIAAQAITTEPYVGVDENQLEAESVMQNGNGEGWSSNVAQWTCYGLMPYGLEEPASISVGDGHNRRSVNTWTASTGVTFTGTNNIDVWYRCETMQPGNGNTAIPSDGSGSVSVTSPSSYSPNGGAHAGQPLAPNINPIAPSPSGGVAQPPPTSSCSGTCTCPVTSQCCCPGNLAVGGTYPPYPACAGCVQSPNCSCTTSGNGGALSPYPNDGAPPVVSTLNDFASSTTIPAPTYLTYTANGGSSAVRPTYSPPFQAGTSTPCQAPLACDIRFRREIKAQNYNFQWGYVGKE